MSKVSAKAATPKTTSKVTTVSKNSERVELALNIANIAAKQEQFMKAVSTLNEYTTDKLNELDLLIHSKKEDLTTLENDFNRVKKDKEIEVTQFLDEFKYEGAKQILEKCDEVPINADKLDSLNMRVKELETDINKKVSEAVAVAKAAADKELKNSTNNLEMAHKAETADLGAEVKQQQLQIKSLNAVIDNLKFELAEQRKLTQSVAEAARMAPITVNSGGK